MDDAHTKVVEDFALSEARYSQAKEEYKAAREALLGLFDKQIGEQEKSIGKWGVKVEYPEKLKWNSDELAALYGSDLPAHVKQSLSVDIRTLRKLPESQQQELAGCYEQAIGTPSIDVWVK